MKKLLKLLGCSRSRSKKLSSANEEKTTEIPQDTHNKKIENSFNSENENENGNNNKKRIKNINSENDFQKQDSIENISIDKKEIFNEINGFNINENIDLDELLI